VSDALLLRPQSDRRGQAAVDRDGQLQVSLRLRVSGRAGEAGADTADGPMLPGDDTGSRGVFGWLAVRPRRHWQD